MRGSVDGFKGQTFLEKCCFKGKTISIIKSTEGSVFGGFTDLVFDGSDKWIKGNRNSFLYAILDNKIIKCNCINEDEEIYSGV
jgi:hypothetical protein